MKRPKLFSLVALVVGVLLIRSLSAFSSDPAPQRVETMGSAKGRVAFVSLRDGNHEIYSMKPDGSDLKRLTFELAADEAPVWSPDGTRIAFQSYRDGKELQIYVMNADGSGVRPLTRGEATHEGPTWSPDGRQLAFMAKIPRQSDLYIMNADGTNPRKVPTGHKLSWNPAWSPDGKRLAFVSGADNQRDLLLIELDSGRVRNLTRRRMWAYDPVWAPDGKGLAFTSWNPPDKTIWMIDAESADARAIFRDISSVVGWRTSWSPGGEWLAIEYKPYERDLLRFLFNRHNWEIYAIRRDGSQMTRLTFHRAMDIWPNWSR